MRCQSFFFVLFSLSSRAQASIFGHRVNNKWNFELEIIVLHSRNNNYNNDKTAIASDKLFTVQG